MLAEHGKESLPWSIKVKLQGLPGPVASKTFLDWSQLPYTPEEYYAKVTQKLEELFPQSDFMPGAQDLLQYLKSKDIPIALATSSYNHTFQIKTAHLKDNGFDLFGEHIVTGDDKRVPPGRGKPHPDIWLVALESLNNDLKKEAEASNTEFIPIKPEECLVFEDGMPGVLGAKAAGSTVIYVPDPRALEAHGKEKVEAEINGYGEILPSLEHFDKEKYGL